VRVPKGQTSVFYDVEAARLDSAKQAAEAAAAAEAERRGEEEVADASETM
jgi:hypothetical protein